MMFVQQGMDQQAAPGTLISASFPNQKVNGKHASGGLTFLCLSSCHPKGNLLCFRCRRLQMSQQTLLSEG